MLPSRGLRPAAFLSTASRSTFAPSRLNGSRKISTGILRPSNAILSSRGISPLRSSRLRTNAITAATIPTLSSLRYNSSKPAQVAESAAASADGTVVAAQATTEEALPTLSELTKDLTAEDLVSMPERIGYLKDIGLDYGWGPTAVVEWMLEHVHIYTGTPWWASIIITSLAMRLLVAPLYIKASDQLARQHALKTIIDPINERMKTAMASGRTDEAQLARQQLRIVLKEAGISPLASLKGPIIQGLLGFGAFRLIRAMADLPVPGLLTGGFGWIRDLSIADPYFILPATIAGCMHLVARAGGESGVQTLSSSQQKIMLYGLPAISVMFVTFMPAALQLTFAVSSAWGLLQTKALRSERVRNALGITPIYNPYANLQADNGPRLNISPKYQPPTARGIIQDAPAKEVDEGVIGGMKSGFKEMVTKAATQAQAYAQRGEKAEKKGGRSKKYLKEAEKFEQEWQEQQKLKNLK